MTKHTSDYDYPLPRELIAQRPLKNRADARLMLVDRQSQSVSHHHVRDLPDLLRPNDCLVFNDTRVVPARLVGERADTGGRWEGLFLAADDSGAWKMLCKTRGRLREGERVVAHSPDHRHELTIRLLLKQEGGIWLGRPESEEPAFELLERVGRVPLPCSIRGGVMMESDRAAYQTVYARHPGSAAAPTAGLHFTELLLERIAARGIGLLHVTLHVGIDTFRPISTESLDEHRMHSEWGRLNAETAVRLRQCRKSGGRIVAVGTTSVRVLESAAAGGALNAWEGTTDLFIRPPYRFQAVDALMTNFHLPRSTLLVLVRTFGGDTLLKRAYQEAVEQRYRFYSYGDAMLIV